jgi:hypothetical protein
MSSNEFEKAYLNEYAKTLRDSADRDYISARAMYKLEIDDKFFWHSQQALEKYLKAILLFNEIKVKKQGHDLVKLYNRMIETLKVNDESEVKKYLEEFQMLGLNRYHVNSTFTIICPLVILDKLVYFFRKICKAIQNKRDIETIKTVTFNDEYKRINIFSGYLEKVLENKKEKYTEQRKILVWKNLYFGKQIKKKIKNIKLKSSGGSSLLYRHKDAYVMLKDYIQLSKEEKNFYNRHHNLNASQES